MQLLFVIGPTNAGKSTFLSEVQKARRNSIGLVEVGKILRKKYPPGYFNGQQAPKHTAGEAWQLMLDGIDAHLKDDKEIVLIDGQPRDIQQCRDVIASYVFSDYMARFVHLYAPIDVRENRAKLRDAGDPEKLKLSLARLHNDMAPLYDVVSMILSVAPHAVHTFDTSCDSYEPLRAFDYVLHPKA